MSESGLKTMKYAVAPRKAMMNMNRRCRPCPMDNPMRNSAAPVISQNRMSVMVVTTALRALRRTTRKMSYKKPAAAPSAREEAACSS